MTKEFFFGCLIIVLVGWLGFFSPFHHPPIAPLSPTLAKKIGLQIWQNECAGKIEGLTTWNEGEEFASLGIGHFIWYPEGREQRFKQSFPGLISFLQSHGVSLPNWLAESKGCPWQSKKEFEAARNTEKLKELRELLATHVDLQILFIVKRLDRALPTLLRSTAKKNRRHLASQFYRLAHTPGGIFVLVDYLNFKGEGTAAHESYHDHGWGLHQVLMDMQGTESGMPAVEEFIASAKRILTLRVQNAPPERAEGRWLKGWHNRVEGYRQFAISLDQLNS